MAGKRGRWVLNEKDGQFREGKASPRLLPKNLRELPADSVTQDEDDETKAHELDPDHIVQSVKDDLQQDELKDKAPRVFQDPASSKNDDIRKKMNEFLEFIPPGISVPLNQKRIDGVRFRIINQLVQRAYEMHAKGATKFPTLFHVWFHHDNIADYELRAGAPPSQAMLPARLKRFDLVIDLEAWPQRILDALEYAGFVIPKKIDVKREVEKINEANRSENGEHFDDTPRFGSLPGLPEPGGGAAKSFIQ